VLAIPGDVTAAWLLFPDLPGLHGVDGGRHSFLPPNTINYLWACDICGYGLVSLHSIPPSWWEGNEDAMPCTLPQERLPGSVIKRNERSHGSQQGTLAALHHLN